MAARRDIRFYRGDQYDHTVVFDTDQSAYSFEALIDQDAEIAFTPNVSGASVGLTLAASVSALLDDSSHTWRLVRTIGTAPLTILSGSVIVDD